MLSSASCASLRCRLGAASYPPGLAARGVWALLSGVYASCGHRSATRPGVLPPLRTPVTDCPHAPRLRPSPPDGVAPYAAAHLPASTIASLSSPLRRMALTLSEPRRGRADGIPGSERHVTPCHASAGQESVTRRPGEGERRPPRSAELRSMRDQPPAPAQGPPRVGTISDPQDDMTDSTHHTSSVSPCQTDVWRDARSGGGYMFRYWLCGLVSSYRHNILSTTH